MNTLKFSRNLFTILLLSVIFVACSDDDDVSQPPTSNNNNNGSNQTIADIAIESNQTDSLVVALSRVGLVDLVDDEAQNLTVFAPTNEAFEDYLMLSGLNSISEIPETTLTAVLQYHVVSGRVESSNLNDDTYLTTLNTQAPGGNNTVIEVDVSGGVQLNDDASVTTADIDASNGVIHIIDRLITPQNVAELAINDERFTTLVEALTAYNFTYAAILSGNGPFTVFAPTNAAFDDLLATNIAWNSVTDIDSVTLASVLTYHVINGKNIRASQLVQGNSETTLNGQDLMFDLSNGAQITTADTSQSNVNIIVTDVQGTNGVVHAIDQVLLPL